MIDIRRPKVTDPTTEGQLRQIKDYLHQLAGQLNFALSATEKKITEYADSSPKGNGSESKAEELSTQNKEALFFSLKNMIIKSADIVNAYYDVIEERLTGNYSALSDFGTYSLKVDSLEKKTAENETTFRESIQTIEDDLGNLSEIRSTFYMKTGWLDDNNTIGGIEIGRSKQGGDGEDTAFARFTTGALTFYDGGGTSDSNRLAWFSGTTMCINDARIMGDLDLGAEYKLDTSNGVAFKCIG